MEEAGILGDYLIVSSTHGSGIPQEWKGPEFWSRWEAVLLGHDNDEAGDAMAERIALLAGRELHRVKVPDSLGKDWTDFWQNGGDVHLFNQQVNNATVVSVQVKNSNGSPEQFGRVSYDPVDINGAYHGGHLYYIAQVMMREQGIDERGQLVPLERLETLVVRSDGTTHSYYKSPAPKGTPDSQRVLRLTDGTLISKEPKPNQYSTWSWQSISKYVDGKAKVRSIAEIVGDVVDLLKASVWLPYEEDYAVLAFTVPVTFLQSVFESVPLILLNGPAASGKTATGISMSKLCANGNVIGQVSAATAARHIDECRGFVVMDDLEAISAKGGKDAQFSELVQALKVSYNKYSGVKVWTDVKTMKTERLNFYGVKMINNTLGADDILGSRMIRVQTRSIPEGFQSEHLRDLTAEDEQKMAALRNELHTWAFMNVDQVAEVYSKEFANRSNRAAEIAAPLRVFARLVGDPALSGQLEASLARQSQKTIESDDPIDTLKEALENIVAQGYDTVTLTHIGMEMRSLLDANFGQSASTEIPEWSRPEWIGKVLRSNDLAKHGTSGRKRIFGKNLRLVGIADWFVSKVRDKFQQEGVEIETGTKGPDDFCRGCQDCPYRNNGCEIMTARLQVESKSKR
ncbi:hypothetical protein [Zhongshania marina]|uniref:Uncharacterized protein n=1 Tax=Zhongshania marina TaxID=2304603 RepID=A0A2S4HC14_9GAMM|nr:hypothetical protein [Marortus luteolus]POP51542.1 hypothetical protein C0068_16530 [Marortus luteolus]